MHGYGSVKHNSVPKKKGDNIMTQPKIINLTPHPVTLTIDNGLSITFGVSSTVARVMDEESSIDYITHTTEGLTMKIPVERYNSTSISGLPEPSEGVTYIVSSQVARVAVSIGRTDEDLVCPRVDATSVRDEFNRVIAVKGFRKW